MRFSSKFAGFALFLVTSVSKGKRRGGVVAARAKMVGLAPPMCAPLVDSGVGVRGWWECTLSRIAPLVLPGVPCIRSVMGCLQPIERGTGVRELIHALATGDQPSVGVNEKGWVVLLVGKRLDVVGVLGNVGMRRGRSRAEDSQHRRHEQGY